MSNTPLRSLAPKKTETWPRAGRGASSPPAASPPPFIRPIPEASASEDVIKAVAVEIAVAEAGRARPEVPRVDTEHGPRRGLAGEVEDGPGDGSNGGGARVSRVRRHFRPCGGGGGRDGGAG